jgi:hypothetical protein
MNPAIEMHAMYHLRAAHAPIREYALFDRVQADVGPELSPHTFLDVMERLMTHGHVHMSIEHDALATDPEPFSPRYYRVTE